MRRFIAFAVVAVVLGATWLFVRASDETPRVSGLQAAGDPFGEASMLPSGARKAVYAPDGARLAVVADGLLHVSDGRVSRITEPGTRVVEAAWFPAATAVLVAEGPGATGQLSVLERDGSERGVVRLEPSVGFGTGHGMAVLSNERAVLTVVDRPGLGTEEVRSLAVVDLRSGAVRRLTPDEGEEEFGPHRIDEGRFLYTARRADGSTVARSFDVGSSTRRRVGPIGGRAAGVVLDGSTAVVLDGDALLAVPVDDPDAEAQRIGSVAEGSSVVAVHPAGGQAVVTASTLEADGSQVTRLRRLALRPPRIRPDAGTPG